MTRVLKYSSGSKIYLGAIWLAVAAFLFTSVQTAEAVSQFSRKYEVECNTCHTVFPRLNYFGERFMLNGFQWPGGKADGDKQGKKELSEDLFIDQVGNWLGGRISLRAANFKTNDLAKNGTLSDSVNLGNPNWLQFFVAGSIFKDVAIFIEQEFEDTDSKFSWFHLFFTNLYGTYVNFQVGKLSPVDFTPFSDRLRIWQKSEVLNVKSSGGGLENSVNIRQSRPGIQYYGYSGPVVWFAGADNGKDSKDTDRAKNFWGGLRLYLPPSLEGPFEGSSVGFHYYSGTDTANTAVNQFQNDFQRFTLAGNVRYNTDLDIQFVYQYGEDDNYFLTASPFKAQFNGFTVVGAYQQDKWYYILQYDRINSNDVPVLEVDKLSPSIWYLLRANFKVGLIARVDLSNAVQKKHEVGVEIRTMF